MLARVLITLMLLTATAAHAVGHVYKGAKSFYPGGAVYGSGGSATYYAPTTSVGISTPEVAWCFDTTDNQTIWVDFWFPADNTSNTFTPVIKFYGDGTADGGTAVFGVTMIAIPNGAVWSFITGVDDGIRGNNTNRSSAILGSNAVEWRSLIAPISPLNIATALACSSTTCQNAHVLVRIERLNTTASVCTDNSGASTLGTLAPFACCLTSACAPSSEYGHSACITGIDFTY